MKITLYPEAKEFYLVQQDEAVIINNDQNLRTRGLSTCSALIVCGGGKRLMAHVDALSNSYDLAQSINDHFDLSDDNLKLVIVPGTGDFGFTDMSLNKIYEVLENFGLNQKAMNIPIYKDFMKDLVFDSKGDVSVQNKAIPASEIMIKDGLSYRFATAAKENDVTELDGGKIKVSGSVIPGMEYEHVYDNAVLGADPFENDFEGRVGVYILAT